MACAQFYGARYEAYCYVRPCPCSPVLINGYYLGSSSGLLLDWFWLRVRVRDDTLTLLT